MKGKRKLTPRGAVWAGLLATPVLVVAVVAAIGVAVAPAGPSTAAAPAATVASTEVVSHASRQTVARGRGVLDRGTHGGSAAVSDAYAVGRADDRSRNARPDGGADRLTDRRTRCVAERNCARQLGSRYVTGAAGHPVPRLHPVHPLVDRSGDTTSSRTSTVLKMFFSQDHDGNGSRQQLRLQRLLDGAGRGVDCRALRNEQPQRRRSCNGGFSYQRPGLSRLRQRRPSLSWLLGCRTT